MATNMEAKKKNNNIKRMYNTLRQQIEEEEYEDALNICEKILKLDPEDAKALKCKLVCMIYENQIEEAVLNRFFPLPVPPFNICLIPSMIRII